MNKRLWFSILLIFGIALFIISCKEEEADVEDYLDAPVCSGSFSPRTYDHQVVGFYPYYRHSTLPISDISWGKLTRVIYAFATPNADGTLNTSNLTGISELVEQGHAHGVEVYVSIGGGGSGSDHLPAIAASNEASDRLVREIRQYVFAHCLDGADIDWENWTGALTNTVIQEESMAFAEILRKLKNELQPFGLGLSIDVYASNWGGRHILEVEDYVDYLQVMAYDFTGPWSAPGPHSSFEDAIGSGSDVSSTGLAYWSNYRNWPKEKILLGVPFYGRDFDNQGGAGITYASIMEIDPEAWSYDQVDNIYYNGIPTMVQKAEYVKNNGYPGVMIWELGQDHPADSLSLLNALDHELNP